MKPVTIYTTPSCGYCAAAKEFFRTLGIAIAEKDVSSDRAAAHEMVEKSGQMGVPVIVIGGGDEEEIIVGFDEHELRAALERSAA